MQIAQFVNDTRRVDVFIFIILQSSYPVIDLVLQGLKPTEKTLYFGDVTGCADVALQLDPPFNGNFQSMLDNLMEGVGLNYGCLVANGSLLGCTKDWWTLSGSTSIVINGKNCN